MDFLPPYVATDSYKTSPTAGIIILPYDFRREPARFFIMEYGHIAFDAMDIFMSIFDNNMTCINADIAGYYMIDELLNSDIKFIEIKDYNLLLKPTPIDLMKFLLCEPDDYPHSENIDFFIEGSDFTDFYRNEHDINKDLESKLKLSGDIVSANDLVTNDLVNSNRRMLKDAYESQGVFFVNYREKNVGIGIDDRFRTIGYFE